MKYIIFPTNHADRKIGKKTNGDKKLLKHLKKSLIILSEYPFYPGLETHKIISQYTGKEALSSWVTGDYRIIWRFKERDHIVLLDFGTHNEVYQ